MANKIYLEQEEEKIILTVRSGYNRTSLNTMDVKELITELSDKLQEIERTKLHREFEKLVEHYGVEEFRDVVEEWKESKQK